MKNKKTIRLIKCGQCGALQQATWLVGSGLLVMDSMMTEEYRKNCRPYFNSHIDSNPEFGNICPNCNHDFSDDESWSACLVNHGDDTACIHCPECKTYISKSALWHKTTWDIENLILEEIDDEDESLELDKEGFYYTFGELELDKFKVGKVKELK